MKKHVQRSRVVATAVMLSVWLFWAAVASVPALAEGGNPVVPPESLPADTTFEVVAPSTSSDGSMTTTTFEVILLVLEIVL